MMIGSPYQTVECLAEDMEFMCGFKPEMIGIGPFLPHKDTPFRSCPQGSYELTLFLLSICRIMLPDVLLPATTALGTINPKGREQGVLSGANVIMPNLSPVAVRKNICSMTTRYAQVTSQHSAELALKDEWSP